MLFFDIDSVPLVRNAAFLHYFLLVVIAVAQPNMGSSRGDQRTYLSHSGDDYEEGQCTDQSCDESWCATRQLPGVTVVSKKRIAQSSHPGNDYEEGQCTDQSGDESWCVARRSPAVAVVSRKRIVASTASPSERVVETIVSFGSSSARRSADGFDVILDSSDDESDLPIGADTSTECPSDGVSDIDSMDVEFAGDRLPLPQQHASSMSLSLPLVVSSRVILIKNRNSRWARNSRWVMKVKTSLDEKLRDSPWRTKRNRNMRLVAHN